MGKFPDPDSDTDNEPIGDADEFKDRHNSCTDLPCLLLWIVCLIGFAYTIGYGFANGNLKRLHAGIDEKGQVCGVSEAVDLKPVTYFCAPTLTEVTNGIDTASLMGHAVCLEKCPTAAGETITECPQDRQTSYPTVSKMDYCVPAGADDISTKMAGGFGEAASGGVSSVMKLGESMLKGWPLYIGTFCIAVIMGYAYLFCLKALARPLVFGAIIVVFICLCSLGGILFHQARDVGTNNVMKENFGKMATFTAYTFGTLCFAGAFGIACLLCCCFSQIDMAVIAVQMTTDVMANLPSLLLAPLIKACAKFVSCIILLFGFVYLLSVAHPKQVLGSSVARHFEYNDFEWFLIWYYVFMFGWFMAFMTALYQFSIAYATGEYFYSHNGGDDDERDVGHCNFLEGLGVGLMWHQGTFAFGSFIIAVFSFIQRVIEYQERQNPDNPVARAILCMCYCCVTFCKSFAEFINKNAYIDVALKGHSFCVAAKQALHIMVECAAGMVILNGATYVFQLVGLVLITVVTLVLAEALTQLSMFTDPTSQMFLENPVMVVIVCGLIAFGIAKLFMDVFDMVSDTLMFCLGLEGWKTGGKEPRCVTDAMDQAKSTAHE